MNLHFMSLASGSSGNCYYLGNKEKGILIDAGIGIRTIKKVLKENNIPLEKIVALLITHDHADHIKSAGCLGEKYHIPIYTTQTIADGMNRSYAMTEKLYSSHRSIIKEVPFSIGEFVITAFEVPHDGSDNIGYIVEYEGHRFAFATDLGHIPAHVASFLERAHYLVLEANYDHEMLSNGVYPDFLKQRIKGPNGHLCNQETADFIARIASPQLKYVFLCHLSRDNNHPELAYKTIEYRLSQQGVRVGKDMEVVVLKRNNPSQTYIFEPPTQE